MEPALGRDLFASGSLTQWSAAGTTSAVACAVIDVLSGMLTVRVVGKWNSSERGFPLAPFGQLKPLERSETFRIPHQDDGGVVEVNRFPAGPLGQDGSACQLRGQKGEIRLAGGEDRLVHRFAVIQFPMLGD